MTIIQKLSIEFEKDLFLQVRITQIMSIFAKNVTSTAKNSFTWSRGRRTDSSTKKDIVLVRTSSQKIDTVIVIERYLGPKRYRSDIVNDNNLTF